MTSFAKMLPVTVDNSTATTPLNQYPMSVSVSGSAYTALKAACRSDLADMEWRDADKLTLLNWWLEGDDTANSVMYFVVKVPYVANGATRIINLFYGNAAVTVSSSNATNALTCTASAPTATNIYTQSTTVGFDGFGAAIKLQQQTGGNASRNGYYLYLLQVGGDTGNQTGHAHLYMGTSTDSGGSWSFVQILNPGATNAAIVGTIFEGSDGTVYICYSYDANTNVIVGNGVFYVAKSTDGGQTFNIGSNTSFKMFDTVNQALGAWIERANGDFWMPYYGRDSTDTGDGSFLLICTSGNDPTVGANWAFKGGSKSTAAIALYDAGNSRGYNETWVVTTSDASHLLAAMRISGGSTAGIYLSTSSDAGVTWSTPVVQAQTSGLQALSPCLMKTSDNLIWLSYIESSNLSIACSYDYGTTFERALVVARQNASATYSSLISAGHDLFCVFDNGHVGLGSDAATILVPADYYFNTVAFAADYQNFEAGTWDSSWTFHGTSVTFDTGTKHNGTQSIKLSNSTSQAQANYKRWIGTPAHGSVSFWLSQNTDPNGNIMGIAVMSSNTFNLTRAYLGPLNITGIGAAGPWPVKWYDGTSYHDFTTPVNQVKDQWTKYQIMWTIADSVRANGISRVSINNAFKGQTTGWSGGALADRVGWTAWTGVTGYLDDLRSEQWVPTLPAFNVGTAVGASGLLLARRRALAA